ncbi:hypothetical protein niasHT_025656 [Heterodera trifolii]|uniref:Uncharacterized protein n=1 Tax=Heterodera trifolii TaxID=157864 RepID=A0ABD2KJ51_9BILA
MLNDNNKRMFKELLNNSSNLLGIYENLIEAKKLAVFQQIPKDLLGRRTKRADDNAIKGCIISVLLTLLSAPYLGYYSFKYAHEGNVQIEYTECYKHLFSYRCYPVHSSVVWEIVEWTIKFAIGLILALLFCSCARR